MIPAETNGLIRLQLNTPSGPVSVALQYAPQPIEDVKPK